VGLEESPLSHTEISLSSEYESKTKTSMGLALPLYTSPPPIDSPPPYPIMSQHNLHAIIRQQQEQLAAMCYGTLNTNNFLFYFLLFFLILLFFFFILFPWRDDEEGT